MSKQQASITQCLDEAMEGLTAFNADRLEAIEQQIRTITAEFLEQGLAESKESLPELLRKHTMLGELLNATAANLRVVVSVLDAKRITRTTRRDDFHGYFDLTAEPV